MKREGGQEQVSLYIRLVKEKLGPFGGGNGRNLTYKNFMHKVFFSSHLLHKGKCTLNIIDI